jgi:hypothetical protein
MLFHSTTEWPITRDAEGGGLGGGGGNENGAGSDGAAGGFADAGNASASFDASISAVDSSGASNSNNAGNVSGGGLDANANGGPGVVDLGGASPSASSAMQFTAGDAAVLGGTALGVAGGVVAAVTGSPAVGVLSAASVVVGASDPLATAMGHAAHDLGVIGATSPVADPNNIGLFESSSEQGTTDAINSDGGFGVLFPVSGGQVLDQSVGGNILATDQVAGGHSLYWDNFYQVNPYALVHL